VGKRSNKKEKNGIHHIDFAFLTHEFIGTRKTRMGRHEMDVESLTSRVISKGFACFSALALLFPFTISNLESRWRNEAKRLHRKKAFIFTLIYSRKVCDG